MLGIGLATFGLPFKDWSYWVCSGARVCLVRYCLLSGGLVVTCCAET